MIRRLVILAMIMWAAHASAAALLNTGGGPLLQVDGTHLLNVGTAAPTLPVCRWDIDRWNATTCTWGS